MNKHRRPGPSYKTGYKVLLEPRTLSNANKRISSRLASRYGGPYTIKKKVVLCSYMIGRNDGSEIVGTYHLSAIRQFQEEDVVEPMIPLCRQGQPRKKTDQSCNNNSQRHGPGDPKGTKQGEQSSSAGAEAPLKRGPGRPRKNI